MQGEKILLVDDDKNITEILEFNLKSEGFDVRAVHSAEEASQLQISDYQLILLDVMMGGMSGYQWAQKLRKSGHTLPIIFLTAKDTENDMLTGFSVGGDDYIAKPFSIKEVIARTKAVLKRSNTAATPHSGIEIGPLRIDLELKEVFISEEQTPLTKTEFELLALLIQNPETLYSRSQIIAILWKETPYITARTVDVHIARLRKKLGPLGEAITNRSGYGYRFNTELL